MQQYQGKKLDGRPLRITMETKNTITRPRGRGGPTRRGQPQGGRDGRGQTFKMISILFIQSLVYDQRLSTKMANGAMVSWNNLPLRIHWPPQDHATKRHQSPTRSHVLGHQR